MAAKASKKPQKPGYRTGVFETRFSTMLNPSPFLPPVPNVALGDYGQVKFPGVRRNGQGLLTAADRDPRSPQNAEKILTGPTTYTRGPTTQRVGGNFPPRIGNLR